MTTPTRFTTRAVFVVVGAACAISAVACTALSDSLTGTPPPVDAGAQSSCPNDFHSACPNPPPSYTTDIAPIFATHCLECHRAGGLEPTEDTFTSYAEIFGDRQAIEDQINDCRMPPLDAGVTQLSTASRVLLLTWLACGAPNN